MNNKVTIIIPFNALNPYVFESIQGCLQLDYLRFLIVLLPDASIHLPKKFKDKKLFLINLQNSFNYPKNLILPSNE